MENLKKRETTLFFLFLQQVLKIAAEVMIEIAVFMVLASAAFNTGLVLPANYVENYLSQIEEQLAHNSPFPAGLLPESCEYGLFDSSLNYVEGNSTDAEKLKTCLTGQMQKYGYKTVAREDGYCVIHYSIAAHFSNPVLHRWVPHLEAVVIVVFVLIFMLLIAMNALRFGKKLKRKLAPLQEEITHIREKDLRLSTACSDIREFNEILASLHEMKTELADSLKKEWATEQRRRENISALAHDIKTPLTIIQGNVELLREETNIEEIYTHADTIHESTGKIEHYIRLLIEETKGEDAAKEEVGLAEMAAGIKEQSGELCHTKQIPLVIKENWTNLAERQIREPERVQRAVLNIVSNAMEHTDRKKGIKITFTEEEGQACIKVEDYGKGFSKEAIRHATEQFYTEHKERSGTHYGLGLYFAQTAAGERGGTLRIRNKEQGEGAEVSFCFPV